MPHDLPYRGERTGKHKSKQKKFGELVPKPSKKKMPEKGRKS